MTAEVHASAFRFVVEGLMGGEALVPGLRERVETIDPESWVPWSEYVDACLALAAVLAPATVRRVGVGIMVAARDHLVSQGFETAAAALARWNEVAGANIRGMTPAETPSVHESEPDRVVIDYALELPPPLIEGFLRGTVLAWGGRVRSYEACEVQVAGRPRLRCTMRWAAAE